MTATCMLSDKEDFMRDPKQDSGVRRKDASDLYLQLYDRDTMEPMPIKQVYINIEVCCGFADFEVNQAYTNESDKSINVIFAIPAW